MHIQYEIHARLPGPFNSLVNSPEALIRIIQPHIVLVCEQLVMEWDAYGIATYAFQEFEILNSNIIILKKLPPFGNEIRSYHFTQHLIDETSRIGASEVEHIAFRIQPVAKVCTFDKKDRAVRRYKFRTLNCHEFYFFRG